MEELAPLQIGYIDEERFEMVDLIHSYQLSADFAHWITQGKFEQTILQEQSESGKYTRVMHYQFDNCIFFNGRGEFYETSLSAEMFKAVMKIPTPYYSSHPDYQSIYKSYISKVITENCYSTIAQLKMGDEMIGMAWEIYDLPFLIKLYRKKMDPLRYWRNSRL